MNFKIKPSIFFEDLLVYRDDRDFLMKERSSIIVWNAVNRLQQTNDELIHFF